jgi:hypothetical protein
MVCPALSPVAGRSACGRDGGYRNGLAGYLTLQSLEKTQALFGPVLMTLRELLEDPPEEKRMTLGELLEWAGD